MSLKSRIKRLEKKSTNLQKEDQEFLEYYSTLDCPSKKESDRRLLIELKLKKLEEIITESFEPAKQELTGE